MRDLDIENSYQRFCEINSFRPEDFWPNVKYVSYLRPKLMKLLWIALVQGEDINPSILTKTSTQRVENLLSPHYKTLYKATVNKENSFFYYLRNSWIIFTVGIFLGISFSVEMYNMFRDWWRML